jgi:hypothetical protein
LLAVLAQVTSENRLVAFALSRGAAIGAHAAIIVLLFFSDHFVKTCTIPESVDFSLAIFAGHFVAPLGEVLVVAHHMKRTIPHTNSQTNSRNKVFIYSCCLLLAYMLYL